MRDGPRRRLGLLAALCLALSAAASGSPLRNLQVAAPPDTRGLDLLCSNGLLHHVFGDSYGRPARHAYAPPPSCGSPEGWQRLVLNLTATSNGTQYDRLGTLWLAHTEIWRTSTAEPTRDGIVWTHFKDVTSYLPLFARPGPVLLDIGNAIDLAHNLTASFDVTLSLLVYGSTHARSEPLPLIVPLSLRSNAGDSGFDSSGAVDVVVPHNAAEAYVEIFVSGNAREEFWYGNAPDEILPHLPSDAGVIGRGPFREVQVWVDELLAGAVTPFPVVYTGGYMPTAWRPVAAFGAFDEPTYVIDITPFLAVLCDDALHRVRLVTVGQDRDLRINANWVVSGNLRFVVGDSQRRTTGRLVRHEVEPRPRVPVVAMIDDGKASAKTTALRRFVAEAQLRIGDAVPVRVATTTETRFANTQRFSRIAEAQDIWQTIASTSVSTRDGRVSLRDEASYLVFVGTTWDPRALRLEAAVDQTYTRTQHWPATAFPGARPQWLETLQFAQGGCQLDPKLGRVVNGTGELRQMLEFGYVGEHETAYRRELAAAGGQIVRDHEDGPLAPPAAPRLLVQPHGRRQVPDESAPPPRWLRRFDPHGVDWRGCHDAM